MRVLRLALGLALAAMVIAVWQRREPVIEAYSDERTPVQFEFDGLDFELQRRTDLGPSPLLVPIAPDTKAAVLPRLVAPTETAAPGLPVGRVDLGGVVTNGAEPVPFATVRIEHLAAEGAAGSPSVASIDLVSDETGHWQLSDVGGGRWRARAFVPEQLASVGADVRFIAEGTATAIDLGVTAPSPALVVSITSPPTRVPDDVATVAITAGRRRVDAEGVVIIDPVPGLSVDLVLGTGALDVISASSAVTDASGVARFGVRCVGVGSTQATVAVASGTVDAQSVAAALTECVPPPPPEPEATDGSSVPDPEGANG